MRVLLLAVAMALLLALSAAPAFAANPHSPGQSGKPNQSCQAQPSSPPGFKTLGFANAETHYNPGSQYDVACFQKSQ